MKGADIVIAGAGLGGAQTAIYLRQHGFRGSILVVGKEPDLPYDRPQLSKDYLSGTKDFDRILIRPEQFWRDRNVSILTGSEIVEVEPSGKRVRLTDGSELGYSSLIWAAGGEARSLDITGSELPGLHRVRNRNDVDRLTQALANGARRIGIVGGGYIGLEAAASLSKLGCEITILESAPRLLARVAGRHISEFLESEHRAHGVQVRTSVNIRAFGGNATSVKWIVLGDNSCIPVDLVIVGVGITPCIGPLRAAGAAVSNGVSVDEFCRTSLRDIYAIGDCAEYASRFSSEALVRLESVQNANDMANAVAKTLCGSPMAYRATPWFWSNQYDIRLQTVGLFSGHEDSVLRGDPATRSFSVVYLKGGAVVALDCVNRSADFIHGKGLVETRASVEPHRLADAALPLKQLMGL